jgi:hypothetical protein
MALILAPFSYSAIISATWNTLYTRSTQQQFLYFISCSSPRRSLSFLKKTYFYASNWRSLLSIYGLMQDALYPSLKDVRLRSIIAAPSAIHNAINHAYATKRGGEGAGWGVGGGSSIRPRVKAEPGP